MMIIAWLSSRIGNLFPYWAMLSLTLECWTCKMTGVQGLGVSLNPKTQLTPKPSSRVEGQFGDSSGLGVLGFRVSGVSSLRRDIGWWSHRGLSG